MAPDHTEIAFWAALGAGATGIVSGVRLSQDGVVICANYDTFKECCGDDRVVRETDWKDISRLDAGFTFRSTVLNIDNQPTGQLGEDKPWQGNLPSKRAIRILNLNRLLILFARRCEVNVLLPAGQHDLIDATLTQLVQTGVVKRVRLFAEQEACEYIAKHYPQASFVLIGLSFNSPVDQLNLAESLGASGLYLDWDHACTSNNSVVEVNDDLKKALAESVISLILGSETMPFAAKAPYIDAVSSLVGIGGVIARGVIPSEEMMRPPALIEHDDFGGDSIDRSLWSVGYSHQNQDTLIFQNDGLQINIKEGGHYSGAAAICLTTVHGRFDAQVDFSVTNPKQGTTFEMAAICINPGYHHPDNSDLNSRTVNLTFDVHGAPPYASSERDENDGFRCGWNNGFNLTKVESDWSAASVNMYNKYGRDVGDGRPNSPTGVLRLMRNDSVFSCYYRDKFNAAWVCSGVMLVQNMSADIYLRLAAKHWNKGGNPAPSNSVCFNKFKLYQF